MILDFKHNNFSTHSQLIWLFQDNVIKWKHFPCYWFFVRGVHRSPVNSPHKSQWRGALVFSLICAWMNGWVNKREVGDLRRHRAYHDVTVIHNEDVVCDKSCQFSFELCLTSLLVRVYRYCAYAISYDIGVHNRRLYNLYFRYIYGEILLRRAIIYCKNVRWITILQIDSNVALFSIMMYPQ